jgi:2-polyprenyl-3-methyl-5-hydroxy-6-metoxy-1,4-benzoquinol methylase
MPQSYARVPTADNRPLHARRVAATIHLSYRVDAEVTVFDCVLHGGTATGMTNTHPLDSTSTPGRARCIVCGSKERVAVFHEFGIDMLECRECGHVYSSWQGGQDYDGYFATVPQESEVEPFWNRQHARMYDDFRRRFLDGRRGRLLDVGCGLGYFVKRAGDVPGWEAYGYEISPHAVAFARQTLGLSNVFCGKVESSDFAPGSFDVITLWDVIEHIPDPDPLLTYLHGLLAHDGILCMHTPNAVVQVPKARIKRRLFGMKPDGHYLEARDHVNLYKTSTLRRVLLRNGFHGITYIHLSPIDAVAGIRAPIARLAKRAWFLTAVLLFHATFGRINLDNLFVVARR